MQCDDSRWLWVAPAFPVLPCDCNGIHATNETKWSECHHHFIVVLGVCGVVSSITTAITHSLIASSVGCAMCGDSMISWCCVVWFCVDCVHWRSHAKKKRGQHTGVLVWYVVCDGGVMWWVITWEEGWWHGGMKRVWKDGVKDTITQKQKDALFPQTTFPHSFPLPQLLPFLILSCCAMTHSMTKSTSLFIQNTYTHQ